MGQKMLNRLQGLPKVYSQPAPFMGGRDAPLRWFLKVSTSFRKTGWRQLRTDVCVFTKHSQAGRLVGIIVIHVDDIMCAALPKIWLEFKEVMKEYKTGEIEMITLAKPITFLPSHPSRVDQVIKVGNTHNILGILFDNNLNFVRCIKKLKATMHRNRRSILKFIPLSV